MHKYLNRLLYTALLGGTLVTAAGHAYADPEHREERREEERHEERREDRHWSRAAPPALRYERHENRRGYQWVGGRWDWRDGRYAWVGGRYEAERRGFMWREPRYELRDGVYVNIDGGWVTAGPRAAPPVLRAERWEVRPGSVWVRGHWDWNGGDWAWAGGHYERERAGFMWREPRWEMRDGVYVKVEGDWVAH